MKVLFVYSPISTTGFGAFFQTTRASTWIHHGIAAVATYAKSLGHDVDVLDLRGLKDWKDVENAFADIRPEVVALTATSADYFDSVRCARLAKAVDSDIVTVIGGFHVSLRPSDAVAEPNFDYIVIGEGELTFGLLLDALSHAQHPAERVLHGTQCSLDALPIVDRDLFDWERIRNAPSALPALGLPLATVVAGRGCVYGCAFCHPASRRVFGPPRRRSVRGVVGELLDLTSRYAIRSVIFHDDCFVADSDWVTDFCRALERANLDLTFCCQARVDIICRNAALLERMQGVGLRSVSVGFESGSQKVLDFLQKGTTVEENVLAAKICRTLGLAIAGNFMFGIPTEEPREVEATLDLVATIAPESTSACFFVPYPGSTLYSYCVRNKLILETNDYNRVSVAPKIVGVDYAFIQERLASLGLLKPAGVQR